MCPSAANAERLLKPKTFLFIFIYVRFGRHFPYLPFVFSERSTDFYGFVGVSLAILWDRLLPTPPSPGAGGRPRGPGRRSRVPGGLREHLGPWSHPPTPQGVSVKRPLTLVPPSDPPNASLGPVGPTHPPEREVTPPFRDQC